MTNRERMLAFVQGRPQDHVPFAQYAGIAPIEEVWQAFGRQKVGLLKWSAVHRIERPGVEVEHHDEERAGRRHRRTTLHTPAGDLWEERAFEPVYGSSSVQKHYVETRDDLEVFIAMLRHSRVVEDLDRYKADLEAVGDDGLPLVATPRSPYQQLWVEWMGLDGLACLMADFPDQMAEVFDLLNGQMRAVFEIARRSPIPFIDIPDNLTAPAIGPERFERYCLPLYAELAEMMGQRPVFVHADGDLEPLWDAIGRSGIRGLDSLTPPPDGDTSVADAVRLWPEMRLGVNFPSSLHLAPEADVYEAACEILSQGGHTGRLQIQVSENVPPDRWRHTYAAIIRAIRENPHA